MKKSVLKYPAFVFFVCAMVLFASCRTTYTYIENVVNVPLLEEKKEFQAAGYASWNHLELQTAYAVTNHFAVQANGFLGGSSFLEAGGGYFNNFRPHHYIEFYGGYGYANMNVPTQTSDKINGKSHSRIIELGQHYYDAKYAAYTNYHRSFLQANYGYKSKGFELGFSVKSNYVYYPHYYFEYRYWRNDAHRDIVYNADTLSRNKVSVFMINAVLTAKYRYKAVGVMIQPGFTLPVNGFTSKNIFHPISRYLYVNAGIYLDLRRFVPNYED